MRRKECIAMLLAGGQGSRLAPLTSKNCKPAVSFGGKYRIIDFALSNCVNSGIDTVGVPIQYKPLVLNSYLGTGAAWDLDSSEGGVHVLPPYATESGGEWYAGTADAIYQNMDFIENYNPEYVLILSGDQLYRMDYSKMLSFHKKKKADLTISVIEVSWEEAKRFGIMSIDEENRITKFAEKPKEPESNLASMGLYIFSWPVLREALLADHVSTESHDFGGDIIPTMLKEGKNIYAYNFSGYWQDVGTHDSYYTAQMELLDPNPEFDIFSEEMRIYSNANIDAPHYVGPNGSIENALICNGCRVLGTVRHSIMAPRARVCEGAVLEDSILLPGAIVESGAVVRHAIIGERSVVSANSVVGSNDAPLVVIGDDVVITKEG